MSNTKHLYIHIPFCADICSYCDFPRIKICGRDEKISKYVDKVIHSLQTECSKGQFETIYIGGGTPNMLPDDVLEKLLYEVSSYINYQNKYEFTVECNPEFVTESQVQIFSNAKVNRVSIGVQTTNNVILEQLERHHTIEDAQHAIELIHSVGIENVSCDFIYALANLTEEDIADSIAFLIDNDIKHVSYYALEVKPGSKLAKEGFIVDEEIEADNLEYINEILELNGYHRYEVSNWCVSKEYESMHNKCYWETEDWKAIGYGASGFENQVLYKYEGSIMEWEKQGTRLSLADYYLQIIMMGLRLVEGINLNIKRNLEAFETYRDDIVYCFIRDKHLRCKNLNILHETLVNIIDETKEKQLENIKDKIYDEDDEW